jgi:hypothetical protein
VQVGRTCTGRERGMRNVVTANQPGRRRTACRRRHLSVAGFVLRCRL